MKLKPIHLVLFAFLVFSPILMSVSRVQALESIDVELVLSSSDYPTYQYGVGHARPTIYYNWQGRNHIVMILHDRLRDYDLTNELYNDYIYSASLNATSATERVIRSITWNVTNEYLYVRVYCAMNTTHIGSYDIRYDVETHDIDITFLKYFKWMTGEELVYTHLLYSHYKDGYFYFWNASDNIVKMDYASAEKVLQVDTGWNAYAPEPTWKFFTRTGHEYMFLGRHLADDPHRVLDVNNFTITDTLISQGDGSPRSNIGAPFKSDTMTSTYWPLTGGGVDQPINNDILWYETNPASTTITLLGQTAFEDADFPSYNGNIDPWACYIVAKLTDGKYFAIIHVNPENVAIWAILNSDFTVYEFQKWSEEPTASAFMYNCAPEYADQTNLPVVDRENRVIWVLLRNEQASIWRVDLYKLDFSSLDIDEWNEYGYEAENRFEATETTPDLNLYNLPAQLGARLGIGSTGGGIVLSIIILLASVLPVAIWGKSFLVPVIVGVCVLGFLTFMGWLPFWIMLIVTLLIAGLWASGISKTFQGG